MGHRRRRAPWGPGPPAGAEGPQPPPWAGAARRGARGARTVRATAAAVGPGWEEGGLGGEVTHDKLFKYRERTKKLENAQNQDSTCV